MFTGVKEAGVAVLVVALGLVLGIGFLLGRCS